MHLEDRVIVSATARLLGNFDDVLESSFFQSTIRLRMLPNIPHTIMTICSIQCIMKVSVCTFVGYTKLWDAMGTSDFQVPLQSLWCCQWHCQVCEIKQEISNSKIGTEFWNLIELAIRVYVLGIEPKSAILGRIKTHYMFVHTLFPSSGRLSVNNILFFCLLRDYILQRTTLNTSKQL